MPFLLRKIRRAKWYKNAHVRWLPEGSLQADALGDLKTEGNKLSVWYVEDNRANLELILIALAANCDQVSDLGYALFDERVVARTGIAVECTTGDTICDEVNNAWHRDLVELSADKLLELAKGIMQQADKDRLTENQTLSLIRKAVDGGVIDKSKLKPGIQQTLAMINH